MALSRSPALALAFAAATFSATPSFAATKPAADDAFTSACLARPNAVPTRCRCEGKLARTTFTAPERAAMIRGLQGDQAGFQASIAGMGEARGKAFIGKVRTLKARSDAQCR